MPARMWTALMVLSAVFAMHGLQCTGAAADGTASHAAIPHTAVPHAAVPHAAAAMPEERTATAVVAMTVAAPMTDHVDAPTAGLPTAASVIAAAMPIPAEHPDSSHGSTGHLWALCLAVLAAGLAVLLARVTGVLMRVPAPGALLTGSRRVKAPPLRPPDLFSLCVLRH